MKREIEAILSGFVVVALTVSMLYGLTKLTERKESYNRFSPFYEQEADFDVIFIGSSHMYNTVYPMELWQDYGIVSYSLNSSNERMPTNYWVLKNALEYTTPKLVVLECIFLSQNEQIPSNINYVHTILDSVPLSPTKFQTIFDLMDSMENRLEFFWNFAAYHDRWTELTRDDFAPDIAVEKGGTLRIGTAVPPEFALIDDSLMSEENTAGVEYLKKILECCQARDIDVLLMFAPFPAEEKYQREANRAAQIADEYGVDYINFLKMDIVNFNTDLHDEAHLNASGARKVTDYLGQYIVNRYGIPDQRDNPDYSEWYEDYKDYTRFKIKTLAASSDLKRYLMLLHDKNLSYCVYLKDNNMWHNGSQYEKLLSNTGIDSDVLISGETTLAVVDNVEGKTTYLSEGDAVDTSFGTVSLIQMEDRKTHVLIDGKDNLNLTGSNIAGAVVIDNATGKAVTASKFAVAETSVNKVS